MIYTFGYTNEIEWLEGVPVERLMENDIRWYWVDFECANQEEIKILSDRFHFNALAIEDCVERLERPKVDFYDTYHFFVFIQHRRRVQIIFSHNSDDAV